MEAVCVCVWDKNTSMPIKLVILKMSKLCLLPSRTNFLNKAFTFIWHFFKLRRSCKHARLQRSAEKEATPPRCSEHAVGVEPNATQKNVSTFLSEWKLVNVLLVVCEHYRKLPQSERSTDWCQFHSVWLPVLPVWGCSLNRSVTPEQS